MKFGLTDSEWEFISSRLVHPLKARQARVWVFGSRARGTHKPFSDLDVLYSLPKGIELPPGFLFELKDFLQESNFPYKVDLVFEPDLAESYRPSAIKERIEV